MSERNIALQDVVTIADMGEVIERYPSGAAYPSELILGWIGSSPLHVVLAYSETGNAVTIVTAYRPDIDTWRPGFRRRRR